MSNKRKLARPRGRQAGHRWLPHTGPLTAKWRREDHREYKLGQVGQAISAGGDILHHRAIKLGVPHVEALCADFLLEPETVLNLFGPDLHAAALVTLHFDDDCLYRQLKTVREFMYRPDVRAQLEAWHAVREAS